MRFVPIAKQSKVARKAYYAAQRGSWHGVNPVTRIREDARHPNRRLQNMTTARCRRAAENGL